YTKHKKDGLEIVGITITSGSAENILDFMNDWNMQYTVLTDIEDNETQVVTSIFGRAIGQPITGLPTTLIIDRDGYIVKGYIGPRSEKTFYEDLKHYLNS
ncbi:MAG: TlpA disulfide reductase family protein, partial [Candidatus Marinimicrobia bacterium]|nr:TlpA disulfide reductase family protein [Candidatus Neomarinimicrobiota bacterium]